MTGMDAFLGTNTQALLLTLGCRVRDSGPSVPMCEKCEAIDVRIARYRLVLAHVDDQIVIDLIKGFIATQPTATPGRALRAGAAPPLEGRSKMTKRQLENVLGVH